MLDKNFKTKSRSKANKSTPFKRKSNKPERASQKNIAKPQKEQMNSLKK